MEETKRKFNWKLAVIVVMLVFSLAKINELESEIANLNNTVANCNHQISNLQSNINSIYNNVDEQLKKEASLLSNVDYTLGELNTENHTVSVTVKLTPKSLTDDMQIAMNVDGQTVAFERHDNVFSATFPVNMFITLGEYPMLTIRAGESTKTELLENVDLYNLHTRYLPNICAEIAPFDTFTNGKLTIDSNFYFDVKPANSHSEVSITKIELVTEKNNKEIAREDATNAFTANKSHIPVKATYDAKYGDEIYIYLIAKDSLGYTYKVPAYCWYQVDENSDSQEVAIDGSTMIYDKNGNLLTGGNE